MLLLPKLGSNTISFFMYQYGITLCTNLVILLLQSPTPVLGSLRNLAFCEKLIDLS